MREEDESNIRGGETDMDLYKRKCEASSAYESFMEEIRQMQVKITYLEAENKMLRNNVAIRLNGLDIAQQCADIAKNSAVPYEQYDQGLAGVFIAKQIKEKFGLEI
jgi:hypothetical protein